MACLNPLSIKPKTCLQEMFGVFEKKQDGRKSKLPM